MIMGTFGPHLAISVHDHERPGVRMLPSGSSLALRLAGQGATPPSGRPCQPGCGCLTAGGNSAGWRGGMVTGCVTAPTAGLLRDPGPLCPIMRRFCIETFRAPIMIVASLGLHLAISGHDLIMSSPSRGCFPKFLPLGRQRAQLTADDGTRRRRCNGCGAPGTYIQASIRVPFTVVLTWRIGPGPIREGRGRIRLSYMHAELASASPAPVRSRSVFSGLAFSMRNSRLMSS